MSSVKFRYQILQDYLRRSGTWYQVLCNANYIYILLRRICNLPACTFEDHQIPLSTTTRRAMTQSCTHERFIRYFLASCCAWYWYHFDDASSRTVHRETTLLLRVGYQSLLNRQKMDRRILSYLAD